MLAGGGGGFRGLGSLTTGGGGGGGGGGEVSCSTITASFERNRNGDRCLKVFKMPFEGRLELCWSERRARGSFVSRSMSSSRKCTVATGGFFSGDCVRKRKRRLREKKRFLELAVEAAAEFTVKSDFDVSVINDGICSWLLFVFAS